MEIKDKQMKKKPINCKTCGQKLPSKKLKRYNEILHELTDCYDDAFHGTVVIRMLDYLAEQIEKLKQFKHK